MLALGIGKVTKGAGGGLGIDLLATMPTCCATDEAVDFSKPAKGRGNEVSFRGSGGGGGIEVD